MTSLTLTLDPLLSLSDEHFFALCAQNRDLSFERTAQGELVVMSPAGSDSGRRNASITGQLWVWSTETGLGEVFDSSSGFILPNGAIRSPDAAWIAQARWDALTPEQKEKFAPLCPDFVIELRSTNDALKPLQTKMQEYLDNGTSLGWLIDPQGQTVEIYRPGKSVELLQSPESLSGESALPGFVLRLKGILVSE
ncbi:MAG: Uma2 family endonuclease [Anaerolineae bacterium]|nr:Uma2 family endonuclease [Gloeobacterales cyanobacterium ES-bin-313]